ncbi:MAG: penicillin-binding protein 1A [Hydrogenophaga sp.]|uniref:penicillin-binding protein 1A n=1 Tax=Hydrogenophaga sp. TaxID=1904254 RepID=UPI002717B3FD|nr:penicillin-binding protein 1A [Hydrogenophaga sp.]MDO9570808.1 penicillin-binding protein 1A [Hydrogenophaga sp.]MDP2220051.1 penicillin-binding protein 1A [Hydrogenophaga sp.]MDP3374441.1 penicillin-binding protein 1A [Hydrogenophaga sp.]MDP3924870.1 penicillin-binding protein 1A [Hydrogenophaga sp.]
MPKDDHASSLHHSPPVSVGRSAVIWIGRLAVGLVGLAVAGGAALLLAVAIALAVAYPNLPDVADLADYRPKLPLRVLTADGQLIGEFGEERRNLLTIREIPEVMKNAVLAIEDARFFEHSGVDYRGMMRAALANLGQAKSQGASTITMQVARNVYLSAEKSYTRKIYEVLLTFKLEHMLTKEQILEIYMNQIFLGQRAYGFSTASQTYFGKPLKNVTIAEAAMLAGLPKAPSAYNPISNPKRARIRQLHIIDRMLENGFITQAEADAAKIEQLTLRPSGIQPTVHAEYVAEMVRQAMVAQYGEEAYTRGLNVTTSLQSHEQQAAYRAVREGVLDYERRQIYRGPELFIDLPVDKVARDDAIDDVLNDRPDNDDLMSAVVLEASTRRVVAVRQDGEPFEITGDGLKPAQSGLSDKAGPNIKIRPGAVIRVVKSGPKSWRITQLPEVESAFVALDPSTGAVRALVGGFDFQKSKFNHVTQAWRQPGSSFKPFIYSAALEKGLSPMTVVNDAPLFYSATQTGGKPWEPKNYDGRFEGPMSVRRALAKSKNMVSIRVLQLVGTQSAQEWVSRFGFDAEKHPPYLTMALGAGSVTPMQMAAGYAVFANGGYRVSPTLITRVVEHKGKVLFEALPTQPTESQRAIDTRNAFIMSSLMQEITRTGTAARAQATLKRPDVYGKTGTTNDSVDAWFVGYQRTVVAAAWVGYDTPRNLGSRETGGGLSLPIWINYMSTALKDVPVVEYSAPFGVINVGGDWYYEEYGPGNGVRALGLNDPSPGAAASDSPAGGGGNTASPAMAPEDRRSILDLFRN